MDLDEISKHVGERVRHYRQIRGMTQAEAAKLAKVSVQTWSRLERGAGQNNTLSTLANIADTLRVGIDDLFLLPEVGSATTVAQIADLLRGLDADGQAGFLLAIQQMSRGRIRR